MPAEQKKLGAVKGWNERVAIPKCTLGVLFWLTSFVWYLLCLQLLYSTHNTPVSPKSEPVMYQNSGQWSPPLNPYPQPQQARNKNGISVYLRVPTSLCFPSTLLCAIFLWHYLQHRVWPILTDKPFRIWFISFYNCITSYLSVISDKHYRCFASLN